MGIPEPWNRNKMVVIEKDVKIDDFVEGNCGDSLLGLDQSIFRLGGVFLTKYKVKDATQKQLDWLEDSETTTIATTWPS